ncbi:MAG TPA: hypothetical protein ENI81_11220, partial [Phycisphaerales bacterium]|nr:hypothetical protein [Phycisphaerales bacterium]
MVGESEDSIPSLGKARLPRRRRQVYLQIVAATVILACGIVIGAGGALLHFKEKIVRDPLPPRPDILREMTHRYGLTEKQADKIDVILKDSWQRMQEQFQAIREQRDAEFKKLSAALEVIFTPEQFRQWQDDSKRRMRGGPGRFGGRRPGPGDGPGPGGRRPPDWPGGPGGGRSGRPRPDGKSGQRRPEY